MENKNLFAVCTIILVSSCIFYMHFKKELYVRYPGFDEFYHLNKAYFIEEHNFLNFGWDLKAKEKGLDLLGHYSPLYHIFLALMFKAGIKETTDFFRFINILPSISGFFLFYFFTKKYFNGSIALISTIILLSVPIVLAQTQIVHPDSFVVLFSILDCIIFFDLLKNKKSWFKQGLVLALSVLTKYNFLMVIFLFFFVLFLLKKLNIRHIKVLSIPILAFFLWALIVFLGASNNGLNPYNEVMQIFTNLTTGATNLTKVPFTFFMDFGPLVSSFAFISLYILYKKKLKSNSLPFLSVFFIFFFVLLLTNHLDFRFLTPALPLLCIGEAVLLSEFFKNKSLILIVGIAFILLFPYTYSNFETIAFMDWVSPHGIHQASQFILQNEKPVNIATPYPEILFWYKINFSSIYNFGNFTDDDSFVKELKENNVTHIIIIPDWCYGRGEDYYNICNFFSNVQRDDVKMIYHYDKVFLFRIE